MLGGAESETRERERERERDFDKRLTAKFFSVDVLESFVFCNYVAPVYRVAVSVTEPLVVLEQHASLQDFCKS